MSTNQPLTQTLLVHPARDLSVSVGVAEGDMLSFADELVMDDVYRLADNAERCGLTIEIAPRGESFVVARESDTGTPGNKLHFDCCVTLMVPDGKLIEAIILVEVEETTAVAVYLLPFGSLQPRTDYRLVGVDRQTATTRFAEASCVAFTRGTLITMASGEQKPIEALEPGDLVLTRDDGPQAIRWIGRNTIRAVGAFAPVMIRKGALNNENDLVLSPDHRVFVYQRQDRLGAGRPEVLVKVRHLVNGSSVLQIEGGYTDYFLLLFDEHQIIYAEGIATESLLIDPRTRAALPEGIGLLRNDYRPHHGYEVKESLLSVPDAVDLLRRASAAE